MKLTELFERIVIINLPYRPDRKEQILKALIQHGLIDKEEDVTIHRAISGDMCPPPHGWHAGNGAWGCLQSHNRVVQDAIMDGLANYLVLEDDACTHRHAADWVEAILRDLPSDWDCLYLGGVHRTPPTPVNDTILRGHQINRTHALALNAKYFVPFQQHINYMPDYEAHFQKWKAGCHIDHQLEYQHLSGNYNIYAPAWWLFGQEEGQSNIGRHAITRKDSETGEVISLNPRYWWHPETDANARTRPFCIVPPDLRPDDELCEHLHFGHNLKEDSVIDSGLEAALRSQLGLKSFVALIGRESLRYQKLPAIPLDPDDTPTREAIAAMWPQVMEVPPLTKAELDHWLPCPPPPAPEKVSREGTQNGNVKDQVAA